MSELKLRLCLLIIILCFHQVRFCKGIVDGEDAEPGEFPFVVSLRNETDHHYCGGALITNRHVLTAAHCLFTDRSIFGTDLVELYNPSDIKAVVDSVDMYRGEPYQALHLSPHPYYNLTNHHSIFHDIGLIELVNEVTTENVKPIDLPIKPIDFMGTATVLGWGIADRKYVGDMSKLSRTLQKVDMQVMKPGRCMDVYLTKIMQHGYVTEALFANTAFCGIHESANTCYRDSGSPVIQDGKLAGIVIFGNECRAGDPDIFTTVHTYKKYIQDCIGGQCSTAKDIRYDPGVSTVEL